MWRCFLASAPRYRVYFVFSTHVEVFLTRSGMFTHKLRFLHACGGVSKFQDNEEEGYTFSPRMWRCFWSAQASLCLEAVFSTHVEVFLAWQDFDVVYDSFLHACGGVSESREWCDPETGFSPRMWRCFLLDKYGLNRKNVFSTHVEVFPRTDFVIGCGTCFLHACGGVSLKLGEGSPCLQFSPRMWRGFHQPWRTGQVRHVFSTHVEVFLR